MRLLITKILILVSTLSLSQSNLIVYDLDTCQRDPSWVLPGFSGTPITCTRPEEVGCQMGCATGCGVNNTCSINTSFLTKGWNTITTDPLRYYEFNISTFPNVSFFLHYIYLSYRRSDTGPTSVSIYVNGAQIGLLPITGTSCTGFGMGINQNYTGNINFRIRFWGASSPDGTIRIDNVRVTHFTTTLPVELVNFSGELQGDKVKLMWQTASESNSSHFEVERSDDVKEWKTIGSVGSAGDSQSLIDYNFFDHEIGGSQILYYRLKQVDQDGQFEYSNIIPINQKNAQIWIKDGSVHYSGENPHKVVISDIWGRFIGNLSSGSYKLDEGIYFINVEGKIYKIAIN